MKDGDDSGPWTHYGKPGRDIHHLSERGVFPLRSLVPVRMDGLIGAQGNAGFSSIVSSAIRLHDHRVPMLLWPWRDLPAGHAAFVAVNRLIARGLIPAARDEVDFLPGAPASKEWLDAVIQRCGGHALEKRPLNEPTRGEAAIMLWKDISRQPAPEWQRLRADDADGDGVADLDDPLPFTPG